MPVPRNGVVQYAVRWLANFLRGAGQQTYRLQCDVEASIQAVGNAVLGELANGSILRVAPT
eukprot:2238526-Amphidinium_carterae.1